MKVEAFEKAFAAWTGAKHAIALNSCTAALFLAQAKGIGAGDEVITSAVTFSSTANTIVHTGAVPVFVDIDPLTLNATLKKLRRPSPRGQRRLYPFISPASRVIWIRFWPLPKSISYLS